MVRAVLIYVTLIALQLATVQSPPEVERYTAGGLVYEVYENPRFGFRLAYPVGLLLPQDEPANGDGLVFLSPDGDVELRVWGTGYAEASIDETFERERSTEGLEPTYDVLRDRFFVVSGFVGDDVLYQKTIMPTSCAARVTVLLRYPAALKGTYDPVVEEVVRSLDTANCG